MSNEAKAFSLTPEQAMLIMQLVTLGCECVAHDATHENQWGARFVLAQINNQCGTLLNELHYHAMSHVESFYDNTPDKVATELEQSIRWVSALNRGFQNAQ